LRHIRSKLTYSNVVSTLCLFLLLGGVAYAVTAAPKNSVTSRSIKNGQVKAADLATNAVKGTKVADGSLTAADLKEGSSSWQPASLWSGFRHSQCWWANYGGDTAEVSYLRDGLGIVHLRGVAKAVDGDTIACGGAIEPGGGPPLFGLPVGYRPPTAEVHAIVSNDKPAGINIAAHGLVHIEVGFPTWPDAKAWVSLDGVTFRCGPSGRHGCP
jgi:hypothetical protein